MGASLGLGELQAGGACSPWLLVPPAQASLLLHPAGPFPRKGTLSVTTEQPDTGLDLIPQRQLRPACSSPITGAAALRAGVPQEASLRRGFSLRAPLPH